MRYFLIGAALWWALAARGQVVVQVGPPLWGPPTPVGTQYYYIPEAQAYYDLANRCFFVFRGNTWVCIPEFQVVYWPGHFHGIVVGYRGPQPWLLIDRHRRMYLPPLPHGPRRAPAVRPSPRRPGRIR
ncbi:hypothetical protein [Hymenobacter siberiensis]|jgi:hypothetical protein|uniref:hypothetical protein n=1 Tax=Hymenobacter siberiensis TaxID=2848396 RepID=UPI001C1DF86A|nr:hypothetical protein [Hymenobacter siberiensis]MBU6120636.1 hypothetical protein [Hymenobacter siberiensis]